MATQTRKRSTTAKKRPSTRKPPAKKSGESPAEPVDRIHQIAAENAAKRAAAEASGEIEPAADEDGRIPDEYEPLLEISTVRKKRPTITIDGEEHELRRYQEFGIADQHLLTNDGETFDKLWNRPDRLNEKERKLLARVLEEMYDMVLIAPAAVKDALDDEQKALVCSTFTLAPLQMAARRAARLAKEMDLEDGETPEPETPGT